MNPSRRMMERFTGTADWDHPDILMATYERHNEEVRKSIPPDRLLVFNARQGWEPLCRALGLSVPDDPFPWANQERALVIVSCISVDEVESLGSAEEIRLLLTALSICTGLPTKGDGISQKTGSG